MDFPMLFTMSVTCARGGRESSLLTTPQKWLFWLWIETPKFLYSPAMESGPTNAAPETGWKGTEKEVGGRRALKNFQVGGYPDGSVG